MDQRVKNPPAVLETQVWSLGWEDPLDKGIATHSGILAWIIPWTEKPGRLQSMRLQRVGHDWAANSQCLSALVCKTAVIIIVLVSLGGCENEGANTWKSLRTVCDMQWILEKFWLLYYCAGLESVAESFWDVVSFESYLYILDNNVLSDVSFANILSQSVACLLILLIPYFAEKKNFISISSADSYFFHGSCFWYYI